MDDFDFQLPGLEGHKRKAFRAAIRGLEAYIHERQRYYEIKDLSATGVGLCVAPGDVFKPGETFSFDLLLHKKIYLAGLQAKVMRVADQKTIGCSYLEMEPRKEALLDKLVLEVQKRLIALRKAKRQMD